MSGFKEAGPLSKQELLQKLKRLNEVSRDIQNTGKSLSIVQNMLQHASLKEKMDKLSQEQAQIVKKIVDTSSDVLSKGEFLRLSRIIDEFQAQIKTCKSSAELNELQKKIDDTVDDWVELFQKIAFDAIKNSR
ncbi:MAG: hypothetical protein RDV48_16930 [Candidatus Eremiobacteraeota bacterium]|nr:hypothetical protein [Candidatus Eremiobacteraeota bacterium]